MYEVESIRRLVKEIDPRFDCNWEEASEEYVITQTSPLGQTSWFDSIRYDQLDKAFFDHMREIVYINRNGSVMDKLADEAQRREENEDKRLDEDVHNLVKEVGKPLYRALRDT